MWENRLSGSERGLGHNPVERPGRPLAYSTVNSNDSRSLNPQPAIDARSQVRVG